MPCCKTELQEDNTGPNPMAMFPVKDMQAGTSGPPLSRQAGERPAPATRSICWRRSRSRTSLERLKKNGGKVVSEIVTIPPGRFAYCTDPDGNRIGLFTRN